MFRRQFLAGVRVTSLGTLASRLLGMLRDMATAALFGLVGGGVMDALVIAFRVPNLFRRLFGEGALSASYLPVLAEKLEHDRPGAWQLASVLFAWLSVVLVAILLVVEAGLALAAWRWGGAEQIRLVIGLTATLMPYMVLVCLTAQLAATLHGLGSFAMPALAPVVLNIFWLSGAWWIAPAVSSDKVVQAYVLAVCVLAAGVAQLAMQVPPLWARGFRFDYNWSSSSAALRKIAAAMTPMMFGLAVTQVNTLTDSFLAWGLAATPERGATIGWLPGEMAYPLRQGAAAAIYYGERLYQFPVGVLGVAVATVIFPLLSRHAARGDHRALGADLTLGLQMVVLLAVPASVGLVILAEPTARLLFEHGEFTAEDAQRTARMIASYGVAAWAFCALPVLVRGFYALGDRATPVRLGAAMVVLNLVVNFALIWPLGEIGLALSTSLCAALQTLLLAAVISRRARGRRGEERPLLDWRRLVHTTFAAIASSTVMGLACWLTARAFSQPTGWSGELMAVLTPIAASVGAYFATLRVLGGEPWAVLRRTWRK